MYESPIKTVKYFQTFCLREFVVIKNLGAEVIVCVFFLQSFGFSAPNSKTPRIAHPRKNLTGERVPWVAVSDAHVMSKV